MGPASLRANLAILSQSAPSTPSRQSDGNPLADEPITYAAVVLSSNPSSTASQQQRHAAARPLSSNASKQELGCDAKASPTLAEVAGKKKPKTKPGPAEAERRRIQALRAKAQRASQKEGVVAAEVGKLEAKLKHWCPQCLGDLQLGPFAPNGQCPNICQVCKWQWAKSEIIVKAASPDVAARYDEL